MPAPNTMQRDRYPIESAPPSPESRRHHDFFVRLLLSLTHLLSNFIDFVERKAVVNLPFSTLVPVIYLFFLTHPLSTLTRASLWLAVARSILSIHSDSIVHLRTIRRTRLITKQKFVWKAICLDTEPRLMRSGTLVEQGRCCAQTKTKHRALVERMLNPRLEESSRSLVF